MPSAPTVNPETSGRGRWTFLRGGVLVCAVTTLLIAVSACSSIPKFGKGSGKPIDQTIRNMPMPKGSEPPQAIVNPDGFTLPHMAVQGREPVRIAMLLPLSGPTSAVGKSLLDAAQLAIFESGRSDLLLMPHDTHGSSAGAVTAVQEAIAQGADIVLGPLLSEEVVAVTPLAQAKHIPVVAFSSNSAIAQPGVFLLSFPPEIEVSRVIDFAVVSGNARFAALMPQTDYGNLVDGALQAAIQKNNVTLTRVEHYTPLAGQMFQPVERLAATLDFTAILIPEGGSNLRSIAPMLPYYGIDTKKVKLLGTGLWDDETLGKEPALIGGWFAAPPPDARNSFSGRFRGAYGRAPPRIASLAYDGVALVATLAVNERGKRFSIPRLTDANGFSGVDGIFRFRPDGRVERGLAVNEVTATGITIVSPAPTTFQLVGY